MKWGIGTLLSRHGLWPFGLRKGSQWATLFTIILFSLNSTAQTEPAVEFYNGHKVRSGEFIIKLKNPTDRRARISAKATNDFMDGVGRRHKMRLKRSFSGLGLHQMQVDRDAMRAKRAEQVISELKSENPEVDYIEPNYIVEKLSAETSSDSGLATTAYNLAQVLTLIGAGYGITSVNIQAQNAWAVVTPSQPTVTVAVIDTGVDLNHTSLAYSIWTNTGEIAGNGVDDDRNGFIDDVHGWNFSAKNNSPQDDNGHGTHVAGIVVGVGDNIFAPPAATTTIQIMPLKFLDANGTGTIADAISAIYYASNNGARVINNSWGGGAYSTAVVEAIAYAYSKDILFVAAAGNSSKSNDSTPSYPASYGVPNVLAVAASDTGDSIASFSNFGQATVPLSAPGVSVLSSWPGSVYAYLSGTSMAAPFVTGTAALMRYQTPQMNSYQIKQLVVQGVDSVSNLHPYVASSGRLNVLNSVNLAMTTAVNSSQPGFAVSLSPQDRELASLIAKQGGGCGTVSGAEMGPEQELLRRIVSSVLLILLPLAFVLALRKKAHPASQRRYDRYALSSKISFRVGDQDLVGDVKSISLGGSEINTDALLQNGSVIKMTISSPDGLQSIQVEGHVVWSHSQKRYGVAFDHLSDTVKAQISAWQQGLQKI